MRKTNFEKIYLNVSVSVFGFLLLFLICNLAIYLAVEGYYTYNPDYGYPDELLAKAYPNRSIEQIHAILDDNALVKYEFEPYTQFKHNEVNGTYVNIDKNGFRKVMEQCSFPIDSKNYNIFVFGGSSTLGVRIPDNETVPSKIQEILNKDSRIEHDKKICIYNFGRTHYFSSQERTLFEKLLADKNIPDLALFIDGLNDFYYASSEPRFSDNFKTYVEGKILPIVLPKLPIMQAINFFINKGDLEDYRKTEKELNKAVDRYINNVRMVSSVGKEFGIDSLFVVQPVPTYNYNLTYHLFLKDINSTGGHINSHLGYQLLKKRNLGENSVWLADMQENKTENLYVDKFHYNTEFSEEIASRIADAIIEKVFKESNLSKA